MPVCLPIQSSSLLAVLSSLGFANLFSYLLKALDSPQKSVSVVAQMVKRLCLQCVRTGFDPLEEGMATNSSILPCEIPWTEEPAGYSPKGLKESDMTNKYSLSFRKAHPCTRTQHFT